MKYQLYSTEGAWTTKKNALETHLGIPTSGTARYAEPRQVTNAAHDDHEKWVMPAVERGRWKCDDQFNSSDLVNNDSSWYESPDFP